MKRGTVYAALYVAVFLVAYGLGAAFGWLDPSEGGLSFPIGACAVLIVVGFILGWGDHMDKQDDMKHLLAMKEWRRQTRTARKQSRPAHRNRRMHNMPRAHRANRHA